MEQEFCALHCGLHGPFGSLPRRAPCTGQCQFRRTNRTAPGPPLASQLSLSSRRLGARSVATTCAPSFARTTAAHVRTHKHTNFEAEQSQRAWQRVRGRAWRR
jgi:hypothetical protein